MTPHFVQITAYQDYLIAVCREGMLYKIYKRPYGWRVNRLYLDESTQ